MNSRRIREDVKTLLRVSYWSSQTRLQFCWINSLIMKREKTMRWVGERTENLVFLVLTSASVDVWSYFQSSESVTQHLTISVKNRLFFSHLFLLLSQQSDCPAAAGYVTVFRAEEPDQTNVRLWPGWWREHEVRTQSVWSAADYRGELLQQLHVALMSPRHVGLLLWKSQAEGSPPDWVHQLLLTEQESVSTNLLIIDQSFLSLIKQKWLDSSNILWNVSDPSLVRRTEDVLYFIWFYFGFGRFQSQILITMISCSLWRTDAAKIKKTCINKYIQ